jgi:hypothetical protein
MAQINEIRASTNHSGLKRRSHGAPDIAALSIQTLFLVVIANGFGRCLTGKMLTLLLERN